ncbi:MAG: oxidoreductase [Gammaproteobacteria bacterium]|nr:oxidoreductase [Gammaproteobacteria bacterium]
MSNERLIVVVANKSIEAQDIASFELVSGDGGELPEFTAGAHIDVHLGDGLIRQYSLCNDPRERHRYRLGVLREAQSRGGSVAMHERVNAGDRISISTPRNTFHLDERASHSILLAGGIGVTPMIAMAYRLAALGASFELHYCTRSRARTAFHDLLTSAPFADRVQLHFDDGPKDQLLDAPALLRSPGAGTSLYVCGPKGMMDYVLGQVGGWPEGRVHREYFSADPQAGHDHDGSFRVRIASTGAEYEIPANKTIVDALAGHGVDIPVSCEQGICGTCLTGVLEGQPDHRDAFLSDDEHAANTQMTPCCSRAKSALIVLDL